MVRRILVALARPRRCPGGRPLRRRHRHLRLALGAGHRHRAAPPGGARVEPGRSAAGGRPRRRRSRHRRRADPLRRPPRPHHLLDRRLHDESLHDGRRRRLPRRRRLRLRALLLGARLLVHQRPRALHRRPHVARDRGDHSPVQRRGRRPHESRRRGLPGLGVDPGGHHARRPLRPQERRPAPPGRRPHPRPPHLGPRPGAARRAAVHLRLRPARHAAAHLRAPGRDPLLPRPRGPGALPRRRPRARAARRLSRLRVHPGAPLRQARRLGPRIHRHPARHHLGLLHAPGLLVGQAARRSQARPGPPDPDRDLFGPRQLRGVPGLGGGVLRARRLQALSRAPPRLPAVLLACGRDHPRPLPRCGRGRRGVREPRRRGAPALRGGRRPGPHESCPATSPRSGSTPASAATASSPPSITAPRAPCSTSWPCATSTVRFPAPSASASWPRATITALAREPATRNTAAPS